MSGKTGREGTIKRILDAVPQARKNADKSADTQQQETLSRNCSHFDRRELGALEKGIKAALNKAEKGEFSGLGLLAKLEDNQSLDVKDTVTQFTNDALDGLKQVRQIFDTLKKVVEVRGDVQRLGEAEFTALTELQEKIPQTLQKLETIGISLPSDYYEALDAPLSPAARAAQKLAISNPAQNQYLAAETERRANEPVQSQGMSR